MLVVALTACTRSPNTAASNPISVYAANPTESDIRGLLGSSDWWEATPSFGVRPLGLPTTLDVVNFSITTRFVHVGTSEFFIAEYQVFSTTSYASQYMTAVQTNTSGATTPSAGDQVVYTTQHQPGNTSLYSSITYVRVGQTIIVIEWDRDQGYASNTTMSRIANHLVTKYKDVSSGKVRPSPLPQTDAKLLPPAGMEITQVGVTKLPVEAAVASLGLSSPQSVVDSFHQAGVTDFLFGDYALNADLNMEVRAMVFTFSTTDDATSWLNAFVGAGNLDSSGVASGYASSAGFYYAFFTGGTHLAMLFCNSLDPQSAASRACESPLSSLIGSWQSSLNQA
jgi:hypothetical protein